MMIQGVSISEMLNQSVTVLTKPSVQSFEQFERRGGQREALIYVGTAAAIAGVVALLFGLLGGIGAALISLIGAFVLPLISFFVFAFVLFFVGKQQGGTGTQDEVFYICALYTAPILAVSGAIGNIPILGCLFLPVSLLLTIYQIYLGYLASRSSMNLDQNKAIISVAAAIVAQWILGGILLSIIATIGVAVGIGTGAIDLNQ
jgi:hypothetical protein